MAERKSGAVQIPPGYWPLQDAKARFSEVVRRARTEGPQHVTVHGREEVVVISAADFSRLKGGVTGQHLIDVMQETAGSDLEFDFDPVRHPAAARNIIL